MGVSAMSPARAKAVAMEIEAAEQARLQAIKDHHAAAELKLEHAQAARAVSDTVAASAAAAADKEVYGWMDEAWERAKAFAQARERAGRERAAYKHELAVASALAARERAACERARLELERERAACERARLELERARLAGDNNE